VSIELGRLLIDAGSVTPADVEAALFLSVVRGIPFPRALVDRGAITERALDAELDRRGGLAMRQVLGARDLFARLPRALCRRLGAVPTRLDPATGTIDVAAADPLDRHIPAEISFHLGQPVRLLRAPMSAIEEAIRAIELEEKQAPQPQRARPRRVTPPSPHGAPQSTIPPPPSEDAPIPLVRRAPPASTEPPPPAWRVPTVRPTGDTAPPPSTREAPLPLRLTKPDRSRDEPRSARPTPSAPASPASSASPASPASPASSGAATPPTPSTQRGPSRSSVIREPDTTPPAISFPSSPPTGPTDLGGMNLDAAAFRAPPVPSRVGVVPGASASASADASGGAGGAAQPGPSPNTLRQGRMHMARPEIHVTIPPPRGERWPQRDGAKDGPALAYDDDEDTSEAAPAGDPTLGGPTLPPPSSERAGRSASASVGSSSEDTLPPTFVDLSDLLDAMDSARSRDEIVALALRGVRMLARRVALFSVRRGAFQGHACSPEFGDAEALKMVSIPANLPSLLATATATSLYLGPVPSTPAHAALLGVMRNPSPDVAAVAVRVAGRPVLIMVADQLGDTLNGTRSMDELARAVGDALTRILSTRV